MNTIRVISFQVLSFVFLGIVIFVNSRKEKENQFSILLRIFTNYTQLIAAAITFNIKFPDSFDSVFSQTQKFNSAEQTFFSFDCFIEDYEIKMFAPSNALFKLTLYMFLPVFLMIVLSIGILVLRTIVHLVNARKKFDTMKYITISFISVLFIYHPTMIYQSLSVFQ